MSKSKRGVGSPPKDFNKAQRRRWREYRASNKYLRREHREILRGVVLAVVSYEVHSQRLEKLVSGKSVTDRKTTALRNYVKMLADNMRDHNRHLIQVTSKVAVPRVPAQKVNGKVKKLTLRGQDDEKDWQGRNPENDHFFEER